MRVLFISQTLGDAYGQERIMRLSNDLLQSAGYETYYLAEELAGPPPQSEGSRTFSGLSAINSLTSSKVVSKLKKQLIDFAESTKPDLVHFIDQFDPKISDIFTKRFPSVLTAHTVAPTCPSSQRFLVKQGGVCEQQSGWSCLLKQNERKCLSHFKSKLHQAHVVWEFERKKRALSSFTRIGAISHFIKKCLVQDGVSPNKICVIPNPVPTTDRTPEPVTDAPTPLLVVASRLVRLKGLDVLLNELNSIRTVPWTLWIFGDGPEKSNLENLSATLDLSSRIIFKGKRPFREIQSALFSAKAFIQPNQGPEGFGMAVAEASSLGVPVVAFDVPAINEIIAKEETGLLVPLERPHQLSEAISRILSSDDFQKTCKENGPKRIQELFSPEKHLESTLKTYQECFELRHNLGLILTD